MRVIGLDTSAYTTSLALADSETGVVLDQRQLLPVKIGERGLRQSEAVFEHVRNLPRVFEKAARQLAEQELAAVGASVSPRNRDGSYMPVFLVGSSYGRCLAASLGVPFYEFSHQEGHIRAALIDSGIDEARPFMAIHFSGGTSEVLRVQRERAGRYNIRLLSSGRDLAAGQLVDRVGVRMGLPFPSGTELEKLAKRIDDGERDIPVIPSAVSDSGFSFSGAEAAAFRLLQDGVPKEAVAFAVLRCIANTLEKVIRQKAEQEGLTQVLLAGGVMANSLVRTRLIYRFAGAKTQLLFARPELATDNAVGVALLTLECHRGDRRC